MIKIFISYAREDKKFALEIYELLKQWRFSPWLDEKEILPGQDWKLQIETAIQDSKIFIACLSSNSVNKRGFVQAELKMALEVLEMIPEGDTYIIPIRLDECKVPPKLSKLQWLNYFDPGAKDRLIAAILYSGNTEHFRSEYNAALQHWQNIKVNYIREMKREKFWSTPPIPDTVKSDLFTFTRAVLFGREDLTDEEVDMLELDMQGKSDEEIAKIYETNIKTIIDKRTETIRKLITVSPWINENDPK
jgi:DNA-binding CsgD family transcriptional regulator